MKQYQKLFIGLTLLLFVSCSSSGGGKDQEVLKKEETSTIPVVAKSGEIKTSNGNITIDDANKVAMTAEKGSQVINGKDGTLSGVFTIGMEASGVNSKSTNNGKIVGGSSADTARSINVNSNGGIKRIGIKASNGGETINNGEISGELSEGIVADGKGSSATNNGKVSFTGVKYTDVYTEDGIEYNKTGTEAIGMRASDGGSVVNEKDGVISGSLSEGMGAEGKGSIVVNYGEINSTGAEWSKTYTDKDGIKHTELGTEANGMYISTGATAINKETGIINLNSEEGIGMYAYDVIYDQNLQLTLTKSMIENYGSVNINAQNGTGIRASKGAAAINAEGAFINLNSGGSNGMYADGMKSTSNESIVENHGTININAENGTGMKALDGGTAINAKDAFINLNSSNGIGMYATGDGSTIENRGKIYLSGSESTPGRDDQTAEEIATSGEMINGKDTKGNIGMKIENGARMINKGSITFGE